MAVIVLAKEKLVRDHIPKIIQQAGETPVVRVVSDDELERFLREKIVEEASELLESGSIEEVADILEAISAFLRVRGVSEDTVRRIQQKKLKERGGFTKGFVLTIKDKE